MFIFDNKKYILIIPLGIFLILLWLSYSAYKNNRTQETTQIHTLPTFKKEPSKKLPIIQNVRGVVKTINTSSLQIELSQFYTMEASTTASTSTKITSLVVFVDKDTVIEKMILKDQNVFKKEAADFMFSKKGTSTISSQNNAPLPFTTKRISLEDISTGEMILISTNQKTSTPKQIVASTILVSLPLPKMEADPILNNNPTKQ